MTFVLVSEQGYYKGIVLRKSNRGSGRTPAVGACDAQVPRPLPLLAGASSASSLKLRRIRGGRLLCALVGAALVYNGRTMVVLPFWTTGYQFAELVLMLGVGLFAYGLRGRFPRKPEDDL